MKHKILLIIINKHNNKKIQKIKKNMSRLHDENNKIVKLYNVMSGNLINHNYPDNFKKQIKCSQDIPDFLLMFEHAKQEHINFNWKIDPVILFEFNSIK